MGIRGRWGLPTLFATPIFGNMRTRQRARSAAVGNTFRIRRARIPVPITWNHGKRFAQDSGSI